VAALDRDDFLCELVERGLQGAAASAAERKRRLLANVVVSAITGDGLVTPDEYLLLMSTVTELEPSHVQLLVLIALPPSEHTQFSRTVTEGALTELDICERWPYATVITRPHDGSPHIIVKNLGPGDTRVVEVTSEANEHGQNPMLDIDIGPFETGWM